MQKHEATCLFINNLSVNKLLFINNFEMTACKIKANKCTLDKISILSARWQKCIKYGHYFFPLSMPKCALSFSVFTII